LDLGTISVAELVVNPLLLGQLFIVFHFKRHVVSRASAKGPASGRAVRLVDQGHGACGAAVANLEPVIVAFRAGLAETEGIDEEAFGLGNLPDRQHGTVKSVGGDIGADLFGGPACALVGIVFDYFQLDSGGMVEANELLPETLLNPGVFHFMAIELFDPEFHRAFRHGVGGGLNLAGTRAALHASIRKGGVHGAGLRVRIRIVQMIVGVAAIKQDGLLDHALAENLRLEVDIFLRSSDTYGHVMDTLYKRHGPLPPP